MSISPLDHPHSVPRYAALQLDASGTAHLLVAQAEALSEQAAFAAQLSGNAQASALVLGASGEAGELTGITAQYVRQQDELEDAVRQTLAAASVGTRLYLCGTEAFIWRVRRIAAAAGMRAEEMRASVHGSSRNVYCVHCGETHGYPSNDEVICAGCGLRLAVRQHFSQALGAYFGACANPDHPYAENQP
ncbi:dimethylamine monooxygenase subunit DmmA family protein [Paraburkholderia sp. A1RI_3L]|uniref:dimethylamine monooxygenase subunit DmmA family protein n=1 Tax=Paraburkholderia TaxID=1822464 RepID=UPI003B7F1C77